MGAISQKSMQYHSAQYNTVQYFKIRKVGINMKYSTVEYKASSRIVTILGGLSV